MKKESIYEMEGRLITIFIYAVFCVLPFYLENHHYNLGEAKSHFLYVVSVGVASLILIWGLCLLFLHYRELDKRKVKKIWNNISIAEKFLALYTILVFVSFAFSKYKAEIPFAG